MMLTLTSTLLSFEGFLIQVITAAMAIGVVIFLFSFALSALVNKATDREPLEF